jgi:hypothetical protein
MFAITTPMTHTATIKATTAATAVKTFCVVLHGFRSVPALTVPSDSTSCSSQINDDGNEI